MRRVVLLLFAVALLALAYSRGGGGEVEPDGALIPWPAENGCPYAEYTFEPEDIVRLPPDFCRDWPEQDWTRRTVRFGQIVRGCGGRDCILALDAPGAVSSDGPYGVARFAPVASVDYPANLPVAVLRVGGSARGYPLHILTLHEIVNDVVAGVPVVASFCPLCNTALAFDRRVDGAALDFGVSGNLRHSDLIMWDRQTETWWQQATGEGIVGRHAGVRLTPLQMSVIAFGDFRRAFPDADVLTEETGFGYRYGRNPYPGYDTAGFPRYLAKSPDGRLPALERVLTLSDGEDHLAVPFSALARSPVATVEFAGTEVLALWAPGVASALDELEIAASRDVGAAAAFRPEAGGRALTFAPAGPGRFTDAETGSVWDVTGLALSGPLAGERLPAVAHTTQFWFAWAAFYPGTAVWTPPADAPAAATR